MRQIYQNKILQEQLNWESTAQTVGTFYYYMEFEGIQSLEFDIRTLTTPTGGTIALTIEGARSKTGYADATTYIDIGSAFFGSASWAVAVNNTSNIATLNFRFVRLVLTLTDPLANADGAWAIDIVKQNAWVSEGDVGPVEVVGNVADNDPDSGNPVKTGGKYNLAAQVYADGDRADTQADINGRTIVNAVGNIADNGVDAGNPIKIGGKYNLAAQVYVDGDRADLQVDANGRTIVNAVGNIADNGVDAGNPIKIGGKYNLAEPVYVDGDRGDLQLDANGRTIVNAVGNIADNGVDAGNPVKAGGKYNLAEPVYVDGDRADLQVDANGKLIANVVGNVADNGVDSGNPVKAGGKYNLAPPTYVDGDRGDLQLDANGKLITSSTVAGSVEVYGDVADNDADSGNPVKVGGVYNAAADTYDDGDRADLQVDINGKILANVVGNVADNGVDSGNPVKAGGKYNAAAPTYADGDRADLQVDVSGRLIGNVVGNIADNAADTGNPVKAGGKYNLVAPTYGDGDRADLQVDVNGALIGAGFNRINNVVDVNVGNQAATVTSAITALFTAEAGAAATSVEIANRGLYKFFHIGIDIAVAGGVLAGTITVETKTRNMTAWSTYGTALILPALAAGSTYGFGFTLNEPLDDIRLRLVGMANSTVEAEAFGRIV